MSVLDGGGKLGVVVAEICCLGVAEARIFDRVRKGLKSWALFLRDCTGEFDARLDLPEVLNSLVGDGSLDWAGEGVKDVEADVHLEGCVSRFALDGTDVSLSLEFKLEILASRPAVLLVFAMMPGLSGGGGGGALLVARCS